MASENKFPTIVDLASAFDLIDRQSRIIAEKDAEIEELKDRAHYAEGTAQLAIKHRDVAENKIGDLQLEVFETQEKLGALILAAESSRDAAVEACGEIVDITLTYAECRDVQTYRDMTRIHVLADTIRSRVQTAREDGAVYRCWRIA